MENKKQYILENVCHLYLKHGIKNITMDDIAGEFGVSKKTLYQFFKDKEDLVSQVFDYFLAHPLFNLNNEKSGNAIDRLFILRQHVQGLLKHFNNNFEFELKKYYPELYRKWYDFRMQKIYRDTFKNINDGKAEGFFREEIDADFVARLQVGRMLYSLNPEYKIFTEEQLTSIDTFDKVMDYHLHAICTKKGLNYYFKILNEVTNRNKEIQIDNTKTEYRI